MKLTLCTLPVLLLLLFACTKKKTGKCPVTCNMYGATVFLSGYAPGEVDTLYKKVYKQNGLFDSLIASDIVLRQDTVIAIINGNIVGLCAIHIDPYYDVEIKVPATGQTFRIAVHDTIAVDTFSCGDIPKGGCTWSFPGAIVTGGSYVPFATGPADAYISLNK